MIKYLHSVRDDLPLLRDTAVSREAIKASGKFILYNGDLYERIIIPHGIRIKTTTAFIGMRDFEDIWNDPDTPCLNELIEKKP